MGFFSSVKKGGSYVFNFKVTSWLGMQQIKDSTNSVKDFGRTIFIPEQAEHKETFEEALIRLNITAEQLEQRRKEFTRLMIIYILIATAILCYSVFIVVYYKNIMGFIMGFAISLYALTYAFRYHFWIYQIKNKKLGCTIKDWFLDIR